MNTKEELYLEKNDFSGHVSSLMCNLFDSGKLIEFYSDCASPPVPPRITCECCTKCSSYEQNQHERLKGIFSSITDEKLLNEEQSPQFMASTRLLNENPTKLDFIDSDDLLQRYIILTLGFSISKGETEQMSSEWFSESNECDWSGITCDEENHILAISMGKFKIFRVTWPIFFASKNNVICFRLFVYRQ